MMYQLLLEHKNERLDSEIIADIIRGVKLLGEYEYEIEGCIYMYFSAGRYSWNNNLYEMVTGYIMNDYIVVAISTIDVYSDSNVIPNKDNMCRAYEYSNSDLKYEIAKIRNDRTVYDNKFKYTRHLDSDRCCNKYGYALTLNSLLPKITKSAYKK